MNEIKDFPLSPPQPQPQPQAPPPPEIPFVELEMGLEAQPQPFPNHPDQAVNPPPPDLQHPHQIYPEWLNLIMGFCFTSIGIGLQCQDSCQLSISFQAARLGMVFALAAFVVSKYIPQNLRTQVQLLEYAGVFCGVTAFFLTVTPTFPLCLKLISWTIYVISFIAIIISHSLDFFL